MFSIRSPLLGLSIGSMTMPVTTPSCVPRDLCYCPAELLLSICQLLCKLRHSSAEVSTTSRAGCKATECKREGIKIQKGQLRFGVFITGPEFQSWAWKHWSVFFKYLMLISLISSACRGCVTPRQISNVKKDVEGEPSQLDGYDELPLDLQEKVANALQQGHVDDEDWGWVILPIDSLYTSH